MRKLNTAAKLTKKSLQELKDLGFTYILVKGYSPDWREDYVGLNYLTLVPVKELPEGQGEKEIYAPIDSEIIEEWAGEPDEGICAFIEGYPFRRK